jgi:hypothetical protein
MSEAAPGDIIIGSGWQQGADGYAGIVVDHGRIINNSSQGVQNNSSLLEIRRGHLEMAAFRYVGFRNYYRGKTLANAGFDPNEPRLTATDSNGTITAKFDGVDVTTGEMVNRKTNVANSTKFANEALRQSVTAAKNGFGVRWEVPNTTVQAQAQRILSTNGIRNITVVVIPRK